MGAVVTRMGACASAWMAAMVGVLPGLSVRSALSNIAFVSVSNAGSHAVAGVDLLCPVCSNLEEWVAAAVNAAACWSGRYLRAISLTTALKLRRIVCVAGLWASLGFGAACFGAGTLIW